MSPTVLRPETFSLTPILFSSEALTVSQEQKNKVRDILEIGASDSRFAEKMYSAIEKVLTVGPTVPPVIESLNPSSAVLGSPSFDLHVLGTGFTSTSKIMWNGSEEPTTFVSATELTTGVDMSTAQVAMDIPVAVLNADGVLSDASVFTLEAVDAPTTLTSSSLKAKIAAAREDEGMTNKDAHSSAHHYTSSK